MITYALPLPNSTLPRPGSLGGFVRKGRGTISSPGFLLFDAILWLGLGIAVAAVALAVFLMTWGGSETAQAQAWVQDTAQRTAAAYMSRPDYSLLTQASAQQDGLFPPAAFTGGQLVNPWGGDFAITGVDTPLKPMGAMVITMDQVPAGDCVKLAGSLVTSADSITVDGTPVSTGHTRPDPQTTSIACETEGRLQFTYVKR